MSTFIFQYVHLLQRLRELEKRLGLDPLSKHESIVLAVIADLCDEHGKHADLTLVRDIVTANGVSAPSLYSCLRSLRKRGLLDKSDVRGAGIYYIPEKLAV